MGIEYPFLAIVASIGLIMIVLSVLMFYIYVYTEINRIPVISGTAEAYVLLGRARVQIRVSHERGEPVVLKNILIQTERGYIECKPDGQCSDVLARVKLVGFNPGGELLPGSTGHAIVEIVQGGEAYFMENKQYKAILEFDKGVLTLSFTILYVVS